MDNVKIELIADGDQQELIEFLVFNNGEKFRDLAVKSVNTVFSKDFARYYFVKAVIDQKIIGCAAFTEELFTIGTWGISWVSVYYEYRKQGIGSKLVKECLFKISERNNSSVSVILATYPNETILYDRVGFQKMGQDHEGGFYMVKHLVKP